MNAALKQKKQLMLAQNTGTKEMHRHVIYAMSRRMMGPKRMRRLISDAMK
jgi:hypothetical protein